MRSLISGLVLFAITAGTFIEKAYAIAVTPLIIELSSGGTSRSAQIIVNNDAAVETPVELKIYRVELGEDGKEKPRKLSAADFIVFPPMRLIPPHGKQVFRIQWAGAALTQSQTYAFEVAQPPVQLPDAKSGVHLDFRFDVFVNVAPPSGTAKLDILEATVAVEKDKRYARLLVSNPGNIHALFTDASLTLRSGAWSQNLTAYDLQRMVGLGLVQPGKRRSIVLPFELPKTVTAISAEIAYSRPSH